MIYIIVGPTASGKSDIAHKLSDILSAPIVNADAFQIYKDMNIGTNKVSISDNHFPKYRLLNIVTPDKTFSVKEYQDAFRSKINELNKSYKNIVVVGGTGLYIRASIYDYDFPSMENNSNINYENYTNEDLHKKLQEVDPESASNIHVNNRKRLIRALTIFDTIKTSKSEIINKQNHDLFYPKEDIKIYFINPSRDELYNRINQRVDEMINVGLIDEVKTLLSKYELSSTAKAGIGYKEVIDYLENKTTLEDCVNLIKQRTRNYAKRQVTYFKHQLDCIEVKDFSDILKDINHE